jgi:hypothetical protein
MELTPADAERACTSAPTMTMIAGFGTNLPAINIKATTPGTKTRDITELMSADLGLKSTKLRQDANQSERCHSIRDSPRQSMDVRAV